MGSNRFGVIFNEFELVIKSYTVAATTVSLQCISIPQKMQLTCERQSQRHAHSCGDWKPLLVIVSFEICVWIPFVWVNICLSISIRVRGKKYGLTQNREKKTKEKQSKRLIQWTFWLWNRNKSVAVSVRLLSHIIFWFVHLLAFIYLLRTRSREISTFLGSFISQRKLCIDVWWTRTVCNLLKYEANEI